jgi:hypothetical protein
LQARQERGMLEALAGRTAVSAVGAAHGPPAGRPWASPTNTGRTSAAPTAESRQDARAPGEDGGQGRPPHQETGKMPVPPEAAP